MCASHIYNLISQLSILYTYIALFIYKYKKITFLFLIMLYL